MISVCIRKTFLHFSVDAPAEGCPVLRRAASDPLSRGGYREPLFSCMRASQKSDDNEHLSHHGDPRGRQFTRGRNTSLSSVNDVRLGKHDRTVAADCDVGCSDVKVYSSQTWASRSEAGPTLLEHEWTEIRVECKDSDQIGKDSSVAMWNIGKPSCIAKEPDAIQAIRAVAPAAPWSKRAYRHTADGQAHERTTVMLRNLPRNLSREDLLALLESRGFGKKIDFLYMPFDLLTRGALGYAFVNLQTPADAALMMRSLDGLNSWPVTSSKRCNVSWSRPLQGLEAHVAEYRNSPLMHEAVPDSCRPLLFEAGKRIPFPPPTKKLKPPRRGAQKVLVPSLWAAGAVQPCSRRCKDFVVSGICAAELHTNHRKSCLPQTPAETLTQSLFGSV